MSASAIHFGTSGWRGIIADDFTFSQVRRAVAAIAKFLKAEQSESGGLVVGHDTRFFSEEFAREAGKILQSHSIPSYRCASAAPTPAIAFEIVRRAGAGGINFTASHNPAAYNGLKFSGANGAPALPEVTREIEKIAAAITEEDSYGRGAAISESMEVRDGYLDDLATKIDLRAIAAANLHFVFDPLFGCGSGYLDHLLKQHGVKVETVHAQRDTLFGGHTPDPSEERLAETGARVAASGAALGLATDGDADRFGILDRDGHFVSPNHLIGLLADYLHETRGWREGLARSVATTHLVDAVGQHHGLPVYETAVGFKYMGELLMSGKIFLGGEESAGLTIRGHVPEKDGILACLLAAEMVAKRGASLGEQLDSLFRKVGSYYPRRINLPLTAKIQDRLKEGLKRDFATFGGRKVARADRTDGLKLLFEDDTWILLRVSGTEPVCRIYCEGHSQAESDALTEIAKTFVTG